jgi:hypothetical protein
MNDLYETIRTIARAREIVNHMDCIDLRDDMLKLIEKYRKEAYNGKGIDDYQVKAVMMEVMTEVYGKPKKMVLDHQSPWGDDYVTEDERGGL